LTHYFTITFSFIILKTHSGSNLGIYTLNITKIMIESLFGDQHGSKHFVPPQKSLPVPHGISGAFLRGSPVAGRGALSALQLG
jgi:hypothetical protein